MTPDAPNPFGSCVLASILWMIFVNICLLMIAGNPNRWSRGQWAMAIVLMGPVAWIITPFSLLWKRLGKVGPVSANKNSLDLSGIDHR